MPEDIIGLVFQGPFVVHSPEKCRGQFCCVHNPSDHPLRDAPLYWRHDRAFMERICEHYVRHPDPDDIYRTAIDGVHDCDGCCSYQKETTLPSSKLRLFALTPHHTYSDDVDLPDGWEEMSEEEQEELAGDEARMMLDDVVHYSWEIVESNDETE